MNHLPLVERSGLALNADGSVNVNSIINLDSTSTTTTTSTSSNLPPPTLSEYRLLYSSKRADPGLMPYVECAGKPLQPMPPVHYQHRYDITGQMGLGLDVVRAPIGTIISKLNCISYAFEAKAGGRVLAGQVIVTCFATNSDTDSPGPLLRSFGFKPERLYYNVAPFINTTYCGISSAQDYLGTQVLEGCDTTVQMVPRDAKGAKEVQKYGMLKTHNLCSCHVQASANPPRAQVLNRPVLNALRIIRLWTFPTGRHPLCMVNGSRFQIEAHALDPNDRGPKAARYQTPYEQCMDVL
eukprot:gene28314-31426_t